MKKVEKKSDSKPKNFTKGTDLLYVIHFEQFNQEIGQTFPANFDEQRVTPKDYKSRDNLGLCKKHSYTRWKMGQRGEEDSVWYDITEPETSAYLGINQLLSYRYYKPEDLFLGNE